MRFSINSAFVAFGGVAVAQLPTTNLVGKINNLTAISTALIPETQSLVGNVSSLAILTSDPWTVLVGLFGLAAAVEQDTSAIRAAGPGQYVGNDARSIGNAFRTFGKITRDLVNVLIVASPLLKLVPGAAPLLLIQFTTLKSDVDDFAKTIGGSVEPGAAKNITAELATFDGTLSDAIKVFNVTSATA
ncbi:hypothetical protein B0T22DRAFT_444513 [Podospora appendiculata]|uniref:Uncharacterized protein n=1 Tax=Podospora appendiculata TaxID=314037 RepID=A0AAE0X105_9PEZI|nr:hypothetical protein B0T22DRAFT_444513 [Podospora appendiculata]